MISLNTNLIATIAGRRLGVATHALNQAMEHLATGQQINRASDDPAGMLAGESLWAEQRGIEKQLERLDLEEHRLGAADGAYSVIDDLVIDLNAIVVQAANRDGLAKGELEALQAQADSILQTIDHLGATTVFNGQRVLEGTSAASLGVVVSVERQDDGTFKEIRRSLASLASGRELNLLDGDLEKAQQVVQTAVESGAARRGAVGARLKEIEGQRAELRTRLENVAAARSAIMDTDFAKETAALARAKVLREAALFVQQTALAQTAAMVLQLLK